MPPVEQRSPWTAALGLVAALLLLPVPGRSDAGARLPVQVARVVDGDTLVVRQGVRARRVRLLGVDAPELARDGRPAEPLAREAFDFVRASVAGARSVALEVAGDRIDDYGRTLGFLWVQGEPGAPPLNLSEELLRRGLATAIRGYDYPGKDRFLDLESQARRGGRGLWRR